MPSQCEIAAAWIESGHARERLRALRRDLDARHAIAAEVLDGIPYATRPGAQHVWLRLPPPWDGAGFARALERRDVRASSAEVFLADPRMHAPEAVRLSISAPPTHTALRSGLGVVAELLQEPPPGGRPLL